MANPTRIATLGAAAVGLAASLSLLTPTPQVELPHAPATATVRTEVAVPAGRVRVRIPGPVAVDMLWAESADARCVPYAPPGRVTENCGDALRPWRHCPVTVVRLLCASELPPLSPLLRLGLPEPPVPFLDCAVNGVPAPCHLSVP